MGGWFDAFENPMMTTHSKKPPQPLIHHSTLDLSPEKPRCPQNRLSTKVEIPLGVSVQFDLVLMFQYRYSIFWTLGWGFSEFRDTLSTVANEFHDQQYWEALSGTTSEKRRREPY